MSTTDHSTPKAGVASNPDRPNGSDADITLMSETRKRVIKIPAKTGFLLGIVLAFFVVIFLLIVLR